jgi:phosphatidylglycerophosphate synthase
MKANIVMGLTYFRVLSAFYLPALFVGEFYKAGVVLAILAAVSDLEGYLARWWNCVSDRGQKWDVTADKVYALVMAGIGWAVCNFNATLLLPLSIILAYDLCMWYLRYHGLVERPCFAGQVKTFLLFPALILMTWQSSGWLVNVPTEKMGFWLLWVAGFFALWSLLHHNNKARDLPDPRPLIGRRIRQLIRLPK